MNTWSPGSNPEKRKRRSQRVMLSVPVTVSGESADGPFTEDTRTMVVNAHGALITLAARISQQQTLRLKSPQSQEEQLCRVTYVGPTTEGRTQLGIEFAEAAPHFWHISFPPEDWTPAGDPASAGKSKA
jgi:hypothetical protein